MNSIYHDKLEYIVMQKDLNKPLNEKDILMLMNAIDATQLTNTSTHRQRQRQRNNNSDGGGRWLQRRPWRCAISLFVLRTPGKTAAFGDFAAAGSASRPWCRLSNGTDSGPELGGTAGSRQGGTAAAVRDLQLGTAAGFEQTNAPSGSSDAGRACVLHP